MLNPEKNMFNDGLISIEEYCDLSCFPTEFSLAQFVSSFSPIFSAKDVKYAKIIAKESVVVMPLFCRKAIHDCRHNLLL